MGERAIYRLFLTIVFCLLTAGQTIFGQTNGDYRSKASGSWSTLATWEIFTGAWAQPTALQGYPGQNGSPSRIDINNNVTLNVNLQNTVSPKINDLYINSGTLDLSTFKFTVNGLTNISGTLSSDNDINSFIVFYGPITINNTGAWTSDPVSSAHLLLYGNVINNSNNVYVTHARAAANITLSGTGTMELDYFEFNANSLTVTNQTTVTINLGLNIGDAVGTVWINQGTLNYAGTTLYLLMSVGGILDASYSGNTINYNYAGAQDIKTPLSSYFNLTTSGSGIKTIYSNLIIAGNLSIGTSTTTLNSNSHDLSIAGNWTDNGAFTAGTRSVTFNGANNQTITNPANETFYNLILNNLGSSGNNNLILSNNVSCNGTLNMTSGNISTGTNTFVILNPAASSLSYTSGVIIGLFERFINQTAQDYLFPVGTASQIQSLTTQFTNLSAGSLLVQYKSGDPGNTGLPLTDADGSEISAQFTSGYWSALAKNSLASSNYNINLNATGFGPYTINAGTRLIKRTNGGSWVLDGVHSDAVGSVVKRTGINSIYNAGTGTQFGIGRSGPKITTQPSDQSVCEGGTTSFSVTASGHPTLTYQWYKVPGVQLVEGGRFTGTNLPAISISNVVLSDAGNYYCIVTDGNGSIKQSTSALLTVTPMPTSPLVMNGERCGTGTVTLQASGALAGEGYKWYDSLTGGTLLQTDGSSYTTPSISATTNYYVTKYDKTSLCESTPRIQVVATIQTQPVAQIITKLPNVTDVCINGTVSATFSGGSGGVSPTDTYESSIDGSGTWLAYTPGSPISSTVPGVNQLQIRTRRTSAGTGCSNSAYNIVTWNVVAQPSWDIYSFPTTNLCVGGQVTFSATLKDGLGGSLTWIRSVTPGGGGTTVTSPDIPPSTGTFYYRPHFVASGQGCNLADGTETIVTVQIDPTWNVITAPATNICTGESVTFSATLNNAGTGTIQWIRSGTSMGAGIVVTSPDAPGVGTYYYRPQYIPGYGGCNLADGTETLVIVHPYPILTSTLTPGPICSGSVFSYSPTSDLGGTSFNWSRATVPGITPAGPTSGTNSPDETLNNSTASSLTVRYVYTLTANGCTNPTTFNVDVLVNPIAVITSSVTANWCNNTSNTYTATSSSLAATFTWTRAVMGGISNLAGSGSTAAITETLNNTTTEPVIVHYLITPSVNSCAGTTFDLSVTVNPTAVITSGSTTNWCNNVSNTYTATSSSSTATFAWTRATVTGISNLAGSGSGATITETLINTTTEPVTVHYLITPSVNGCAGTTFNLSVTVNPTSVINSGATADWCNNISNTYTATSTSSTATFAWTRAVVGGISNLAGSGSTATITETLNNTTTEPVIVHYLITPNVNGCTGTTFNLAVTVNPTSVITSGAIANWCNNISSTYTATSSSSTASFTWTRAVVGGISNLAGSGSMATITETLINTSTAPVVVHYLIIPSVNGCAGTTFDLAVTVNPTGEVDQPASQVVCNGSSTATVTFATVNTGGVTTYTWTNNDISIGLAATGSGNIPMFTATNAGTSPVVATIIVTPHFTSGGVTCDGPTKTFTITVNPTGEVDQPASQVVCNGSSTATVTFGTVNTGGVTTYSWTNNDISIGLAATGSGNIPTFTATNAGTSPVVATIIVTPHFTGGGVTCDGPTKSFTITVNPTPQVVPSTLTQTICNDGTTNVTLTSLSIFTSGVITFNYTVVATGGVTGFTTPVTGLPNNYVIADVLHNPTDSPQTVTYTIVPISPTGCAAGPSKTVVITVNPTPQVVPSTLMQTICNDGTTSVVLTSPSTFTSGVITFNYTVVATGGVTGFTTPVTGLPNNFVISDVLHNPTDTSQTVTYTIVPISPTGCAAGPSKTVVITVDPTPQVVPSTMSQTICNDGTTNVILSSPSTFTHGVITFNYTVVAMGGVTGFTTPVTGLPNNYVIADVLHNPTDAPQTVTYKIVPISPMGCTSDPIKIVNIIVNPTPRIFPVPSNSTQCDSLTTNIRLQSPSIFTSGLITFKYTVTTTGSISGYSSPVSGLSNNQVIGDKLINNTDHFQIVTYQVVPVSPLGCSDGTARGVTVTVNPTPRVIPINLDPSICYTGTLLAPVNTQVVLTSPTVMTTGSMRFDYTVNVSGEPGVVVGNTSPAFNQTPGYTINYQYQNNSDTVQSVYYSIIPKVDNAICVHGRSVVSEVKIHARPLQSIVVTKPLTCSGGAGLAALKAVISKGANPYQIVWDGPVGYHKVDSLAIANLSSGKYVVKVTDNLGCNRKDSISIVPVTARAYISADVIPPGNYNISCIGSTDGRILVSVTGGITPPYKYWVIKNPDTFADTLYSGLFTNNLILSDPTTYRYYNNLGAGTYALVIQDVNGCININKIAFRVPPPIVSSFSKSQHAGYNISCKGYNDGWVSVVTSGGRGTGFTYSWYTFNGNIPGPVNTNRIDIITAGTYFLVTKDVLGCTKLDSTIISEPDGLQLAGYQLSKSADGNFNISCNGGNDGSIAMTISGGSGNNSYSWTGPAGFTSSAKDISGLKAGVYTCIVTDQNNCVLTPSPSFTLTEPTPLVLSTPLTSVSTDGAYNVNCHGANSGWIRITVTGGSIGTYKYNWITTDGSGIINGQKDQLILTAGTYHLIVTDSNNCVITKDIVLTQPPALVTHLTATNITCKSPGFDNGSITLTVSGGITPYTFLWSNGDTSKDLTGLTPGIYTVTATDLNGCIIKDSARIDLPPSLKYTKNLSDYNGFNISCNGLADGFINVDPTTGSAPFVYTWTGPNGYAASTNNISNLISGEYQLLIVDSNECKASETFDLTEPGKLGFTYSLSSSTAGGYNINCAGDLTGSIDIQPVNQVKTVNYLWADGIFGQTRTDLPAGNYSLIITDANNCHASATIAITQPDSLKLIFSVVPPFCPDKPDGSIGTEVTGGVRGAGYLYRWSDNSSNSNLLNIPEGYYKVTVTDMNGCLVKDSVNVKPINETCLIIPNAISPNGDLINDVWNIGMKELYPKMEVIIFNRWGETIWRSERGYPRPWDGTSNGSPLPIDSYHYIIDLHNGSRPFVGNVTIVR